MRKLIAIASVIVCQAVAQAAPPEAISNFKLSLNPAANGVLAYNSANDRIEAVTTLSGLALTGTTSLTLTASGTGTTVPTGTGFWRNTSSGVLNAAAQAVTAADAGLGNVTNDAQTKAAVVPNTAPTAGQVLVGNAGGTAYAPVTLGTDATLASNGAITIANGAVSLAKMANINSGTIIYRKTASAGAPETQTLATLKTDLAEVDDTAYNASTWDGVTATAPSKNAVRDKFETLGTAAYTASTAYDAAGAAAAVTPTSLSLVIGTNVQAYDADLTTWAGITPGTGVGTALAVNIGTAGAFVTNGGALGTPSGGTLTNCGSLPISGLTASTSTALGVGSINLGHASDTTIARVGAGQISVAGVNVVTISSTDTLTNKRINPRPTATPSGTTIAIDADATDFYAITALAAGVTFDTTTGTPVQGQHLTIRIKDNGTPQTVAFTTNASKSYRFSSDSAIVTPTVANKTIYYGFIYNLTDARWDCVAIINNF